MSVARRVGPVVVALLGAAIGTGSATGQVEPIPAGTWHFMPEESDEIEQRIDRAVSHMNFLVRRIARGRLRGANRPVEWIEIRYPDQDVYIRFHDDEPPTISPRDGTFVPYTRADGEVVQVNTEVRDGVITQFFDSDDGQKEQVYRLRPDGSMALEVTVLSDRLREPFTYTWVFRQ